jgi:hypothetical protein
MIFPTLADLIPILQISVGPVILVSGVGLLLLSMTNRLGRAIDRARILRQELQAESIKEEHHIRAQLKILWRRADCIRQAIIFSTVSVLLAALLIIMLFVASLFKLDVGGLIAALFVGCLGSLICSLALFLWDVNQSLAALKLELEEALVEEK